MAWPPTTHQDVQDQIGFLQRPYARTGYYHTGSYSTAATGVAALTADFVYARPYLVLAPTSFDRIGLHVSTATAAASGGTLALAIYAPGPTPGALLLETASVSTETTGAKEFTISATLDPGVWWLAVRASAANPTVTALSANSVTPFVGGSTTPPSSAASLASYVDPIGAGATAFPSPFVVNTTSSSLPFIVLRAA